MQNPGVGTSQDPGEKLARKFLGASRLHRGQPGLWPRSAYPSGGKIVKGQGQHQEQESRRDVKEQYPKDHGKDQIVHGSP